MLSKAEMNARSLRLSGGTPNRYTGTLNDPLMEAQANYAGPGWAQFFGSLQKQEEDARVAGKNYRVGWGGFGNATSLGGSPDRSGDDDVLHANAINAYLGELTDQNRLKEERYKQTQAQTSLAESAARGATQQEQDQAMLDRALQSGGQPARAIVGANGNYATAAPAGPVPEAVRRENMLRMMPAVAQQHYRDQWAKQDAEALAVRKQDEVERANKAKEAASAPFVPPMDASGAPVMGDALLHTLPSAKQNLVKRVLAGEQAIPTGAALKDPYWKGLLEVAGLVDPNFDTTNYNARSQTRADFTKGKAAGQINAINTVVGHLSDLAETGEKLGNTGLNWVNTVYNKLTPGGSNRGVNVNNFETLKEGVANELMRVWRQVGAGSEKEIEDWKATIGASKSPEELRGAFKTIGGMLESKLGALDTQYKQGMGTDKVSAISPESRSKLDRLQGAKNAAAPAPAKGGQDPLGIR